MLRFVSIAKVTDCRRSYVSSRLATHDARAWRQRHLGQRHRGRVSQRTITGIALLLYLITATGIPIVVKPVASDRIPFPCQDHPCGCTSAAQCWTSCCCFSHAEKLAWAERHGVVPPSIATAKATSRTCCSSKTAQYVPGSRSSDYGDCVTSDSHACHVAGSGDCSSDGTNTPPARGVVLIEALACRGLQVDWIGGGVTLLPSEPEPLIDGRVIYNVPFVDCLVTSVSVTPPTPPPRLGALT
jgi:hypothetical protein